MCSSGAEGAFGRGRKGDCRESGPRSQSPFCLVTEFESGLESCAFEESKILILEIDLSGRTMEYRLEKSQVGNFFNNLSKKWALPFVNGRERRKSWFQEWGRRLGDTTQQPVGRRNRDLIAVRFLAIGTYYLAL